MKPTDRLKALEAASEPTASHPTAIMITPFGAPEMPRERFKELEAAAREKQGKPTGVIIVPWKEETNDTKNTN